MRKHLVWPIVVGLCAGCGTLGSHTSESPQAPTTVDHLESASQCLERGDEAGAVTHLSAYVEANPEHAVVRAHLAELLMRQNRAGEAKRHFTTYVALAQQQGEPADRHLLLSHTRLTDIARAEGDVYNDHLHRGIGLWLLASQVQRLESPDDDTPDPQELLFKAIRQLKLAAAERNDETRPHWYLHEVWAALGQQHPARQSLNLARERAPLSDLTPAERQWLAMAR